MSTTSRTITVNATPGDATKTAERVSENLRAAGHTVTIGTEYTQKDGHKAGMLSVDLTIDTPDSPVEAAPEAPPVTEAPSETVEKVVPFDDPELDNYHHGDIHNVPKRYPKKKTETAS